jgi:hypothetical protein
MVQDTNADSRDEEEQPSLVERLFDHPSNISQGEYTAIYELLMDPDVCNDPQLIAGILEEFSGWAQYMLEKMHKADLVDETKE